MPGSILGSHGDEFEARNVLLQLALGLVSASRRLDAVLDRHGRVGVGPTAPVTPVTAADAILVDFVLGVVAFRNRVLSAVVAARRARPPVPSPPSRSPLDGMLR